MKKITSKDVERKADFVTSYLEYLIEVECENNIWYLIYNYGFEGQDIVVAGTLSDCNNHLNYLIRKMGLKEDWVEENK